MNFASFEIGRAYCSRNAYGNIKDVYCVVRRTTWEITVTCGSRLQSFPLGRSILGEYFYPLGPQFKFPIVRAN